MVPSALRSLPAVTLVVLAVVTVGVGIQTYPHPGQSEYHHTTTAVDGPVESGEVLRYADLSDRGQRAVRAAVAGEDATLYGSGVPEFTYASDAPAPGNGVQYVRYEGQVYRVTGTEGWWQFLDWVGLGLFALAGLVLGAIGLESYRTDRPRPAAVALIAVAAIVAVDRSPLFATVPDTQVALAIAAVAVLAPVAVAWVLLGRIERTDRSREGTGT